MIGFPPKAQTSVYLDQYTPDQYRSLSWMAMEQLGWQISQVTENSVNAITPFSWLSFRDRVVANVSDYEAEFTSSSSGMQIIDFNRNPKNLQQLTDAIASVIQNTPAQKLEEEFAARRGATRAFSTPSYISIERERIVDSFLAIFKPVPGYYVTPILIIFNILVYLLLGLTTLFTGNSFLSIHPLILIQFGADFKLYTLTNEPWRLFSSVFMHLDLAHLLFNMYVLMVCGVYIERIIGSWKFLAAYLICGFAASTTSLWWNDLIPSVGASGAIYGIIGVMLAMLSLKKLIEPVERKSVLISLLITIFFDYTIAVIQRRHIDHGGYFGGLIFGFLLTRGYYFAIFQEKKAWLKKWAFTTCTTTVAVLAVILFVGMKWNAQEYADQVDRLKRNEAMASSVSDYTLFGNGRRLYADASISNKIKNFGIYYMDQNLSLLEEMDEGTFSPGAKRVNKALREYYSLCKEYYEVQYARIEMGDYQYNNRIDELFDQLQVEKKKIAQLGFYYK